jgi:hypothetical protein
MSGTLNGNRGGRLDAFCAGAQFVEAELAEGDVFATWSDYNEMINSLKLRAADLNLSGADADRISGLPERYAQKLLGPNQIRRLGAVSLGPFLGALCAKGQFVEDKAAVEKLRSKTTPRNNSYVRDGMRAGSVHVVLTDRFMRKIRKKGGENSRKYLGRRLVKQLAQKAANARWRKGEVMRTRSVKY